MSGDAHGDGAPGTTERAGGAAPSAMTERAGGAAPSAMTERGDSAPAHELRGAAVHGIRWSSISRPSTEVIALAAMVVLARLIAPAEFGRYAVALIGQEVAFTLIAGGLGLALIQRKSLRADHLQAGMALGLIGGVGLALLMLLAAGLIVEPIFGARTAVFVRLMTPICLISALNIVPSATLSRRMAFRRLSEIEVVGAVMRVVPAICLALAGFGGEALIFGTLAGAATTTAIAWMSAPPPAPRLHREASRELLRYSVPVSLSTIGWIGFSNVDYAIIGARLGSLQTGLYYRAYTLAVEYQKKVSVVMSQVGFPVLSRARGEADLSELRRHMVRLLTVVLFPMLALLAIVAPVLVPFLFGPRWEGAVEPVQILALGGASTLVIEGVGTVLMATGRTKALLGFGMAHFVAYGLAVWLVVSHGIVAVAIAAAIVHTAFLLGAYALMLRGSSGHPLRLLWNDVAPAVVSCAGLAVVAIPAELALSAVQAPALAQLAAVALLAASGYLLTLRACFPQTARGLRAVVGQVLPEHRRLRWAKRRLQPADARATSRPTALTS